MVSQEHSSSYNPAPYAFVKVDYFASVYIRRFCGLGDYPWKLQCRFVCQLCRRTRHTSHNTVSRPKICSNYGQLWDTSRSGYSDFLKFNKLTIASQRYL